MVRADADGWHVAGCGAVFALAGIALWILPPKPIFATVSALLATAMISLILAVPDTTATVPMFYLWPLVPSPTSTRRRCSRPACCGWPAPRARAAHRRDAGDQVTYIGAVSIVTMLAALIALTRRNEQALRASLERSSSTDSLTGLLNRERSFLLTAQRSPKRAREATA